MTSQYNACEVYAKSFNQKVASELIELLAEEVIYSSYWVFESMTGKSTVAPYLQDKIDAIRSAPEQLIMGLAQCVDGYAVTAFQQQSSTDAVWLEKPKAVMMIEINADGLITSMHMTDYAFAGIEKLLHVYPGWKGNPNLVPHDRVVLTQPGYKELELYLILLDGKISLDRQMLAEMEEVKEFLDGVIVSVHAFQTLTDKQVTRLIMQSSISGFPAIIATVRGHIVWHATGLLKGEDIAKRLQQVLAVRRA